MGVPGHKLTLGEFLEGENALPERNEYCRGEVFVMAGGGHTHSSVVANLARYLGIQLGDSQCQVFGQSMKLQIADDTILYPDYPVYQSFHPTPAAYGPCTTRARPHLWI